MMDTNVIAQVTQAAPAAQSALNAWNVVALGVGAALTHAWHTVVAGGGVKNIVRKFWSGADKPASGN